MQTTRRAFLQASLVGATVPALATGSGRAVDSTARHAPSRRSTVAGPSRSGASPRQTGGTRSGSSVTATVRTTAATDVKTVRGRILLADGSPAAHGTLYAHDADGRTVGGDNTDAAGEFEFIVPASAATLEFYHLYSNPVSSWFWPRFDQSHPLLPRNGTVDIYEVSIDGPGPVDLGTLRLPTGHVLDVRVVDPAGAPVPTASVDIVQREGDQNVGYYNVWTNGDGYHQTRDDDTGLELAGDVEVIVEPPDCDRFPDETYVRNLTVTGPTTVEVTVDAGPEIPVSGRILRPDGQPAANNTVATFNSSFLKSVHTDEEGRFSTTLPTCTKDVQFYQLYDADLETKSFDILDGDVAAPTDGTPDMHAIPLPDSGDIGTVTLPRGHMLDVRVTDPDGNPVSDAHYEVVHRDGISGAGLLGTLDAGGRLRFESGDDAGIELAGDVEVEIRPPDDDAFGDVVAWADLTVTEPRSVSLVLPYENPFVLTAEATTTHVVPGGVERVAVTLENAGDRAYESLRVEVDADALLEGWSIEREIPNGNHYQADWDAAQSTWDVPELSPGESVSRGLLVRAPESALPGLERDLPVRVRNSLGDTLVQDTATLSIEDGFDPTVHGFGFSNWSSAPMDWLDGDERFPDHAHQVVSRQEVASVVSQSVLEDWADAGVDVTPGLDAALAQFLYTLVNVSSASDGHCYGMVYAAKEYYENPDSIPVTGVSTAADISSPSPSGADRVGSDIDRYHNTQLLNSQAVTAIVALKHGGDIEYGAVLDTITSAIDEQGTAPVALADERGSVGHQVLAYDYEASADATTVYVYDPNAAAGDYWDVETGQSHYFRDVTLRFDTSGSSVAFDDLYISVPGDSHDHATTYTRVVPLLDGEALDDPVSAFGTFVAGELGGCLGDALSGSMTVEVLFGGRSSTDRSSARPAATDDDVTVTVTDPNGDPLASPDSPFVTYEHVDFDAVHYRLGAPAGDYAVSIDANTDREVTVRSKGNVRDGGTIDAEYTTTATADEPTRLVASLPETADEPGDIRESESPPPVGDSPNQPTDPDGDGLYEDVDGDGVFDMADAKALFDNLDDDAVQNNVAAFDFNGDGRVDVVDVQKLLVRLS